MGSCSEGVIGFQVFSNFIQRQFIRIDQTGKLKGSASMVCLMVECAAKQRERKKRGQNTGAL